VTPTRPALASSARPRRRGVFAAIHGEGRASTPPSRPKASAAQQGAIVPAKREIFEDKRFESGRPPKGNWTTCPALAPVQPPFNPLIYSADAILPIISFGQGSEWRPAYDRSVRLGDVTLPPAAVSWAKSIEIAIGWICGLLLGAVVSGFIKKE
jgi:hypothetical protein